MKKLLFAISVLIILTNNLDAQKYERYKKLVDTTLISTNLGYKKNITVTVPIEWQNDINNKFPLIILFDRQRKRNHNYILNTIDYLTSNDQIPSCIILSVESTQEHRYLETLHAASNPQGKANENEKFIFDELIPLAEKQFKASSFRLLIGHSRHGYFTSSIFQSKLEELNAVIALSPFFYQQHINLVDSISLLNDRALKATKYFRFAIGNDYPEDYQQMDSVVVKMNNLQINSKGILLKQAEHYAIPSLTIAQLLYEVFEFWAKEQTQLLFAKEVKESESYEVFNNNILNHYGSQLKYSFGMLNAKGWRYFNESNFTTAIQTWQKLLEAYPNFSEAYLYIMEAENKLNKKNPKTVEAFKRSLENSNLYSEFKKMDLLNELE